MNQTKKEAMKNTRNSRVSHHVCKYFGKDLDHQLEYLMMPGQK